MDAHRTGIWLSTRKTFRSGDPAWEKYVDFVGLPHLSETRTIDAALNAYVEDSGDYAVPSFDALPRLLEQAPAPAAADEYRLLWLDAETQPAPPPELGAILLGHDLTDETHTSTLLNCGRWEGGLEPFTRRLNGYGLLSFEDAVAAKALLPRVKPDEPHALVTVWALYELPRGSVGARR